jgi:hypothetical protein
MGRFDAGAQVDKRDRGGATCRKVPQHKVAGTHMTFVDVHQIQSGGDPVYGKGGSTPHGTMHRQLGVSFISDTRLPSTFAHEAGHFVGDMSHEGLDNALLMREKAPGARSRSSRKTVQRESLAKRQAADARALSPVGWCRHAIAPRPGRPRHQR